MTDSDGDLLQRCRQGDEAAWRELVAPHTRRVFNLAYRFVGRVDEAEDLTQEIFVKVYQSLDRYRPSEGAFTTWLTTVARNQAIDHYRRRREERARRTDDPAVLDDVRSRRGGPAARPRARGARASSCTAACAPCPPTCASRSSCATSRACPTRRAARVLGIPLGTVKSRINRGRLELAKRLLGGAAS